MTDWPHAPPHRLTDAGAYMVTSGTYKKASLLNTGAKRDVVLNLLFECAGEFDWVLHAWAVMSNHYHFLASSAAKPELLPKLISKLHTLSAREINVYDSQPGRRVWYQYCDSHITFTNSYLARLNYVHRNPEHHGVVSCAEDYPWCSSAWFGRHASPAFRKTVNSFKTDHIRVKDDF